MPQIAIIADDLTGAADTGASFACAGLVTLVALDPAAGPPESDVLVISTESRHLAQDEAVAQVRLAANQIRAERVEGEVIWVYKKMDSTLRGHLGPELAVVIATLGFEQALVAPAFPAQGRTTVGGRQLVDGTPVDHTSFGREVGCSDLLVLFHTVMEGCSPRLADLNTVRRGLEAVCEVLDAPGPAVVVADAETDADLVTIAQAAVTGHVRLLCGSAGLARALAKVLALVPRAPVPAPLPPADGPVLVVAGSGHPCTTRQVAVAQQRGAIVVRPARALTGGVERTVEIAAGYLGGGQTVVLTAAGLCDSPFGSHVVATRLAQVAQRLVADRQVGGLVLTGGETAAAACAALGASVLRLRGETQPGIAWGVLLDGVLPGLPVVTKAGGFGTDDALVAAISRLAAC